MLVALLCSHCGTNGAVKDTIGNSDSIVAQPASWFTVKQVAEKVWRIDDHGGGNMYLVEGNDKALLIDAGNGVADLSACVKSITTLPLIVVNTHGHPDHSGGNFQFPVVYAHPSDSASTAFFCNEKYHSGALKRTKESFPEMASLLLSDTGRYATPAYLPIKEGFEFDLGNRTITVIEVPGHTPGSVCLLDAKNKLLFTGDNNNTLVWLFLDGSLPLELYLQTLQYQQKRSEEFTTMFPGHGEPLDKEFIGEQIGCVQNILNGGCTGEPYKTFVDYARVCGYKRAQVAFNPDNLRVKHQ